MESWGSTIEQIWLYGAVPALALAGVVLLFLMRLPTFTRLGEAVRAVRAPAPPGAEGGVPAGAAVALAAAGSIGAGAAVAGATAVALGGAGALPWLWLFGLLLAPLRLADTLLARTSPAGQAKGSPPGSLVGRLAADAQPGVRALGGLLLLALSVGAFAGVAGIHGSPLREASEEVLPGSGMVIGLVVAAAAVALALVGRGRAWLGWIAGGALVALLLVGFLACLSDPGRAGAALFRGVDDAIHGAAAVGAFSGALASEVALAALLNLLPPMALSLGVDGGLHAEARGNTKAVASSALLSTLAHVVVATVVGASLIATGAFSRRVEDERALRETRFYDAPFDTTSQRLEPERAWTGFVRVLEGRAQAEPLEAATERGMVDETRFEMGDGTPGNFAMRVRRGVPALLLLPDDHGALQQAPPERLEEIVVTGSMLPRGGRLLAASMSRIGGDVAARLALAILLVLAALGAGALGLGLARSFEPHLGENARWAGAIPGLGLALAAAAPALGLAPAHTSSLGLFGAAAVAIVTALAILAKAVEASRL